MYHPVEPRPGGLFDAGLQAVTGVVYQEPEAVGSPAHKHLPNLFGKGVEGTGVAHVQPQGGGPSPLLALRARNVRLGSTSPKDPLTRKIGPTNSLAIV
jgi:hypothetical protein